MIEVSEYLKTGGPNHNEWPWKIIDKTKVEKPAHNDKWCVVGNDKAWVSNYHILNLFISDCLYFLKTYNCKRLWTCVCKSSRWS